MQNNTIELISNSNSDLKVTLLVRAHEMNCNESM